MENAEDPMHRAVADANKSRARLYVAFFAALRRRFGRDAAIDVMQEAIRAWGRTLSGGLQACGSRDWDALIDGFVMQPDGGAMFQPVIESREEESLVVHFRSCPLKTAWQEAALDDEEVALFCAMAAQADYGTLEAAGYSVSIETWRPGAPGCCRLRISRRPGR
jgi:hypothetical protein